jgi:hypothetical protein
MVLNKKIENYFIRKNLENEIWRIHKTKEFIKLSFRLVFPHLLSILILILIFPNKWFGILILGLFLSDFSFAIKPFIVLLLGKMNSWYKIGKELSYIAHSILLAASILLLLHQEYVISLSGFIHLFLDLIGF